MSEAVPLISPDDPVFDPSDGDPTVSPADDFYRFVNGGWMERNPVPPEYGAWGAFQEVHERNQEILRELLEDAAAQADPEPRSPAGKVGTYYRSGMDTHTIEDLGLQPIADWLDRIDALASIDELRQLVIDLHGIGLSVPFGVGVSPDFEDATANLLYIGQAGLGLPDRDYYLRDDDTSRQLLADYRQHVSTMLGLLTDDAEAAEAASAAAIAIETAIAELSYTNVQMRDIDLITNKYAMSRARTLMPTFDLGAYLDGIGAGAEAAVNIDNEALYPALDDLMASIDLGDWRHYFRWHLVRSVASSLPERFEQASFEFYGRKLGGQQEQKDRWKRVLAAGTADIGHLISQMYVVDNFTPEAKDRMEVLVESLFAAMRETLTSITWMSDTTKERALEKLDGFGYKIGYPDEWRDYDALILHDGEWLANRLAARSFEVRRQLDLLGRPVDPHEWSMAPHVVNAYYHPLRNEIVFPAGILQPPFFSMDADDAVNYGAIGAVIGHEITHGFDDKGSMFDADGNVRNWWTEDDRTEFDRRAAVMVDQFSAFEVADGLRVNGELTLGENIADLGGLRIALAALMATQDAEAELVGGLTPEQRFFMSWARVWRRTYTDEYLRLIVNSDPHAPSDLRCNAPISNLPSFAAAFGIPLDHPSMRPEDRRVDIW